MEIKTGAFSPQPNLTDTLPSPPWGRGRSRQAGPGEGVRENLLRKQGFMTLQCGARLLAPARNCMKGPQRYKANAAVQPPLSGL